MGGREGNTNNLEPRLKWVSRGKTLTYSSHASLFLPSSAPSPRSTTTSPSGTTKPPSSKTTIPRTPPSDEPADEFDPIDSGSDLEEDDLKTALGKKRRDGRSMHLQLLTTMQRHHIGRLVERYGDDYQAMFMDVKLNKMQHSVATLEKLCKRYHMFGDKIPLISST
ncbi:glycine-rich protein 2 [Hibiscus syriacus]|uniref:Nucleolar protein 16 n=1 Tax=Hibiscus syriacus TaxID=106335 RepID=A0A6A2ZYB4_HIBSY|nr:glycine-rich protein 2 [Hibiscus syriacus]